jgi:uncharacterized protein YecT (DUF1311 family)
VSRISVVVALLPVIVHAQPESFDCTAARTAVEKIICTDSRLSALDYLLGRYYEQALYFSAKPEILKDSQRRWVSQTTNNCQDVPCLKDAYSKRLVFLKMAVLSVTTRSSDHSGTYESGNGELIVQQLSASKIVFDLFVIGPFDKYKLFSPKSNEIHGEAEFVGDTASYEEDEDCTIVFSFLNHNAKVYEYGCWIYAASATGTYTLKRKKIK